MPRPTRQHPERGDAYTPLIEAARDIIRTKVFTATTIDDLCCAAGMTKGAFSHHFKSKNELGVATADDWAAMTGALFADAPYHDRTDPLDRVLAHVAFHKTILQGAVPEFTCLVSTMLQETYETSPAIREACARCITDHAATLNADIEATMRERTFVPDWTAESLASHTQAVIHGAFILATAGNDPGLARESIDHLSRYIELLFSRSQPREGHA